MYSILKTKKKSLVHKKKVPVTNSLFLSNNHILFTFADKSYTIFSLHLSTSDPQQIIAEGTFTQQIIQANRIAQNKCILLTTNCSQILLLNFDEHSQHHEYGINKNIQQHTETNLYKVSVTNIQRGIFPTMLSTNPVSNLLNTMGCQIKLHTFNNHQCFIVQFNIYEDHKIILDCYTLSVVNNKRQYILNTIQIDLQINGIYVVQQCDKNMGQIAIYKQEEIVQADWELKIIRPFFQVPQNTQLFGKMMQKDIQKENMYNIILPTDRFDDNAMIMQVIAWKQLNQYLIVTHSIQHNILEGHILQRHLGTNQIQTLKNFAFFKQNPNFISIIHTDPYKQVFYATTHTHQRIDGQLYENGLVIGNLNNGKSIEKGYWSCKNINLSPDARYILDVPTQFETQGQTFYHVRLLLSKSSLYMFLIQNSYLSTLNDSFKEMIVNLL